MGSGGFGGQQGGFGGGFGGPQGGFGGGFGGQQGGFGGGFGMLQQQQGYGGGGGGYRPSRQRFNQMPQQQMGYGGGFGGQMQGFGMPQQQQGFGNTFARTMPPQQGFGGGYGMPQRPMYGGDTPMAPQQRDPMRPMATAPANRNGTPVEPSSRQSALSIWVAQVGTRLAGVPALARPLHRLSGNRPLASPEIRPQAPGGSAISPRSPRQGQVCPHPPRCASPAAPDPVQCGRGSVWRWSSADERGPQR